MVADGRRIAFDVTESVPPQSSVHVMRSDGTHRLQLVPRRAGFSYVLGWSPNGGSVLYFLAGAGAEHRPRGFWTVRADGTGRRRLLERGTWDSQAAWSPDGTSIAYVTGADVGEPAIRLLDVRERRTRLLARSADSPQWTPNGERIVFASSGEPAGIYVVRVDGATPKLLRRFAARAPWLGEVSPDGRWLVAGYLPGISRISLTDGRLERLTRNRSDWAPAWSPSGKRIAFERDGDIWVMNADGGNPHVVACAPHGRVYTRPYWRP